MPTSVAPSVYANPTNGNLPPAPSFAIGMPPRFSASFDQRVTRLEQLAFGSTYSEHDLTDRVNHLEREVSGQISAGSIADRIAKLEVLLIGGASNQISQLPVSQLPGQLPTRVQSNVQGYPQPPTPPVMPVSSPPAYRHDNLQSNWQIYPQTSLQAKGVDGLNKPGNEASDLVIKAVPYNAHAGDYFGAVRKYANGAVARWQEFPITIHLPVDSPESWLNSLQQDIKKWGQFIPLKVVAQEQPANIEVVWVNHLPQGKLGVTHLNVIKGKMDVMISMLRPTYYLPAVPEKVLQGAFLHELGHGIGIFGHSESKGDIMEDLELVPSKASEPTRFGTITPRDLNTLKHIYETPALPANFSLPQALDMSVTLIGN